MKEQLDQRGGSRYQSSTSESPGPGEIVNQIQAQHREELEQILNRKNRILEALKTKISPQSASPGGQIPDGSEPELDKLIRDAIEGKELSL